MTNWTVEASARLEAYLEELRILARQTDCDADELSADIRKHIEEKVAALGNEIIYFADLEGVLAAVGAPEVVLGVEESVPEGASVSADGKLLRLGGKGGGWRVFFGFVLPIFAIAAEAFFCVFSHFGNSPAPILVHFLQLLVALAAMCYVMHRCEEAFDREPISPRRGKLLFAALGYVLGLSLLYSLLVLPLLPFAIFAIVLAGLGFVAFAPFTALLIGSRYLRYLWKHHAWFGLSAKARRRCFFIPFFAILSINLCSMGAFTLYESALLQAFSSVSEEQEAGRDKLKLLSPFGFERDILIRCYTVKPLAFWMFKYRGEEALRLPENYRQLYFKLTGVPFNSPEIRRPFIFGHWSVLNRVQSLRIEQGRSAPGPQDPSLKLAASRMDGSISAAEAAAAPAPAMAYIEWIVEFENLGPTICEARSEIQLPPGGVVSRLTLWVDGEEREAAFGGKKQVEAAYRDIAVVRRKDPAIVRYLSPDRIRLACFPAPPGERMRVKIGISAPLLYQEGEAVLRLPELAAQNYTPISGLQHEVWIESTAPFKRFSRALKQEEAPEAAYALRGRIDAATQDLPKHLTLSVATPLPLPGCYIGEVNQYRGAIKISSLAASPPLRKLVLVVDGSAVMGEAEIDWAGLLRTAPEACAVKVIIAGKGRPSWSNAEKSREELAALLSAWPYAGGYYPQAALLEGLEFIEDTEAAALFWVHGPNPPLEDRGLALSQYVERRPAPTGGARPRCFSVQVMPGPNALGTILAQRVDYIEAPILFSVRDTLAYLSQHRGLEALQRDYIAGVALPGGALNAGEHLARVAIAASISRQVAKGGAVLKEEALKMGAACRLVTPVSGAVVLENSEQYERHNLDPRADDEAVPGIPEPEEWALLIVSSLALVALILWERKQGRMVAV